MERTKDSNSSESTLRFGSFNADPAVECDNKPERQPQAGEVWLEALKAL